MQFSKRTWAKTCESPILLHGLVGICTYVAWFSVSSFCEPPIIVQLCRVWRNPTFCMISVTRRLLTWTYIHLEETLTSYDLNISYTCLQITFHRVGFPQDLRVLASWAACRDSWKRFAVHWSAAWKPLMAAVGLVSWYSWCLSFPATEWSMMASHGKSCAKHRETQKHSSPMWCRACENFHLFGGGTASKSSKVLIKSKASVAASRASRAHSQWLQPNRSHRLPMKTALLLLWAHLKSGSLLSLGGSPHAVQCWGYLIQRDGLWIWTCWSESESCIRYSLYVIWSHLQSWRHAAPLRPFYIILLSLVLGQRQLPYLASPRL